MLLRATGEQLLDHGFTIVNLDATIIAQAPRMAPHITAMIKCIAETLRIAESQINVKAKTTERLGFTGRGEGIAAQAIALIEAVRAPSAAR
jgi:2-C-methyl-D-erythritol 2,4-cyclodiphosphate synthase